MAKKKSNKTKIRILLATIIIVSLPILFCVYFMDRVYPNVFISGINVGGKTKSEIASLLNSKVAVTPNNIILTYKNNLFSIPLSNLDVKLNKDKTIKRAVQLGRSGNIFFDINQIITSIKRGTNIPLETTVDENYLDNFIADLAKKINIAPINAKFSISDGKVQTFAPEVNGLEIDKDQLKLDILEGAYKNNSDEVIIDIPVKEVEPQVKTTDVNNLGIKELIGSGTSHFAGSISSRIYNINLAASRVNNTLIAPGVSFSFDQTVGDISALNGYQQAYVIENGKTVLGDGGGVCQVSTTLFRAGMAAGLPIIERHAHAYRVHYYEEDADPGLDATIYSPTVDFKFKNDTTNYILIQTQIDLTNLVLTFNLYGTHDGRVSQITKPVLWGYQPAPPALYTNDPTLPVGVIKQIDFAASGIKSQFEYTVTKEGVVINHQTFYSNFQPWQAKFLRGTKI
jgi:vancomycin resistance protein YoaR